MTNFNFRQNAVAAAAALIISATTVLGTIGPVNAGNPVEQSRLAANHGSDQSVQLRRA